jgi:two-component system sensor histidine kinase AlgZ
LENAIYYGIQPLPEGGTIHVIGLFDGHDIRLEIENPLPDQESVNHKGNRIAQENIHQRLQACFGAQAGLTILTEPDLYRVTLRFPYQTELPL